MPASLLGVTQLPSLLLLHGVGDDGNCLQPFVRALEIPNLVVRTPDAPAHGGRLAAPGEDVNWEDMVDEAIDHAATMARDAGPAGVVVGGHSMGSAVAMGVAERHPELVRGLYLEDPPFWDGTAGDLDEAAGPADLADLWHWFTDVQRGTLADAIAAARRDHPNWPQDEFEPWARAKMSVDAETFAEPKSWVRERWAELAPRVTCPALVLAGDPARGSLLGRSAAQMLAELPGWTVKRLPGAGHDVRRDERESAARLLREFLLTLAA